MGVKIFVGNLTRRTTDQELQVLFAPFGSVKWAEVASDAANGGCRGFGFVQMESLIEARRAITSLNGRPFNGRMLRVSESGAPIARQGRATSPPGRSARRR